MAAQHKELREAPPGFLAVLALLGLGWVHCLFCGAQREGVDICCPCLFIGPVPGGVEYRAVLNGRIPSRALGGVAPALAAGDFGGGSWIRFGLMNLFPEDELVCCVL